MKKTANLLAIIVAILSVTIIGMTTGLIVQRAQNELISLELRQAQYNITNLIAKVPKIGTTSGGIAYLSRNAKLYLDVESASLEKDSIGCLDDFIPYMEPGFIQFLDNKILGFPYKSQKKINGKTIFIVDGGFCIVAPI